MLMVGPIVKIPIAVASIFDSLVIEEAMKKIRPVSILLLILGLLIGATSVSWAKRHLLCYAANLITKRSPVIEPRTFFVIDKTGKRILETKANLVGHYSEGLCAFSKNINGKERIGYLDLKGNVAIEPQFGMSGPFSEGIAIVSINPWQEALINPKGELIKVYWPGEIMFSSSFSQGKASASRTNFWNGSEYGYVDKTGTFHFKRDSDKPIEALARATAHIQSDNENLLGFDQDGRWGFKNGAGKYVIPPQFLFAEYKFSNGLAACAININPVQSPSVRYYQDYGYLDDGPQASRLPTFTPPQAADYLIDLKFGLINKSGDWVLKPKYDFIQPASDGMRLIRQNGKYGFISVDGKELIPPVYAGATGFVDGYAIVSPNKFPIRFYPFTNDGVHYPDYKDGVVPYLGLSDPVTVDMGLKVCDGVIKLRPNSATIYSEKCNYLLGQKRFCEALEVCNKGLEVEPERLDLCETRGDLNAKLEKWAEAEHDYSKVIDYYESNGNRVSMLTSIFQKRGVARLKQGKLKEARLDVFMYGSPDYLIHCKKKVSPAIHLEGISLENAVEIFEKLGDLENARSVLLEAVNYRGFNRNCTCFVGLEGILQAEWDKRKAELARVEADPRESEYQLVKARVLAVNALENLVTGKEVEDKVNEVQALLKTQIALLEKIPDSKAKRNFYPAGVKAGLSESKTRLSRSYAECENSFGSANLNTGYARTGNIVCSSSAPNIYNDSYKSVIACGCTNPSAPAVNGSETAAECLDMAKYCSNSGLSNSAWWFANLALTKTRSCREKLDILRFCQTRLSPQNLKSESIIYCHQAMSDLTIGCLPMESDATSVDEKLLLKSIKVEPRFTAAYVILAKKYRSCSKLNEAEKLLDKANEISPNFVMVYVERGRIAALRHDEKSAREAYKKALELDPENQLAQRLLANLTSSKRN